MEKRVPLIQARPQRVLFYGVTGSGKSTAAHRYALATGLPETSADDDIGWLPGWTQRDPAEQTQIAAELAAQEKWVLDSAYSQWADHVLPRAQLIVALDFPRWVSLARLLRRTVRRIVRREIICNGNTESLQKALAADSIIRWHFASFRRKRARIHGFIDDGGPPILRFRRPRDLERWLRTIERGNR